METPDGGPDSSRNGDYDHRLVRLTDDYAQVKNLIAPVFLKSVGQASAL